MRDCTNIYNQSFPTQVFQCSGDDMNLVLTGGVAPVASPKVLSPGTLVPQQPQPQPGLLAQRIAHQSLLARQQENLFLASLRPPMVPMLPGYSVRPTTPQPTYSMQPILQQTQMLSTKRSYDRAFAQTAEASPAKRPFTMQQPMAQTLSLPVFSYGSGTPMFSYGNTAPMFTYANTLPQFQTLPAGYGSALSAALPPTMTSPFPLSMFQTYPYYPGV